MWADVKAYVRDGAIDIGERTPQMIERATGGRRKDDIGVAVTLPHFDVGLAERDIADDIGDQHGRQRRSSFVTWRSPGSASAHERDEKRERREDVPPEDRTGIVDGEVLVAHHVGDVNRGGAPRKLAAMTSIAQAAWTPRTDAAMAPRPMPRLAPAISY